VEMLTPAAEGPAPAGTVASAPPTTIALAAARPGPDPVPRKG